MNVILISLFILGMNDLGVVGNVYEIAERDMTEVIIEKARYVDMEAYIDKKKREIRKYRVETPEIPRALKSRTRIVDVSIISNRDLYDGDRVIKAGERYNPLSNIGLHAVYVLIDAEDDDQIKWFKESALSKQFNVRLMITGGYAFEIMEKLKRSRLFYVPQVFVDRFQIKALPSIVKQNEGEDFITVKEVAID
ncbi:MAG: hypothetical protein GY757_53070 [bacterium]|nr:hypothetical protein [bacterium]